MNATASKITSFQSQSWLQRVEGTRSMRDMSSALSSTTYNFGFVVRSSTCN